MKNGRGSNKALLIIHGLTFLISIFFSTLLPKVLGIEEYITVMQITAFINLLLPIGTFSAPTFLIRQYNSLDRAELLKLIIQLFFIGAAIVIGIVLIAFLGLELLSLNAALLVFLISIFSSLLTTITALARIQSNFYLYFFTTIFVKLLVILILIFYYSKEFLTVNQFFFLWGGSSLCVLLLALIFLRKPLELAKSNNGVVLDTELTSLKEILLFCFPMVIANIITMLLPLIERYFLEGYISSDELALYIFNVDILAKISAIILLMLKVVIFPKIMLSKKDIQIDLFYMYLKKVSLFVGIFALSSPLQAYLFGFFIIEILGYVNYYDFYVAVLLIIFSLITPLNYMLTIGLVLINKNKFLLISTTITLVLHIAGMLLLGKRYAAFGVSLSLVISILISSIILFFYTLVKIHEYKKN